MYPFLYLHAAFQGLKESHITRHLVIDEMQDYTPIQYAALNRMFPCQKTILGDYGQYINPNHLHCLEDLRTIYDKAQFVELNKSYRSTYEIMCFAKKINHVQEIERKDESQLVHLDKRILETPSLAVEGAKLETLRLGRIALENLQNSFDALIKKDHDKIEEVKQRENVVDKVCDSISEYLIKLCTLQISEKDNQTVTSLLNTISDMERVGDHAENIAELAEEMEREDITFSNMALEELSEMTKVTLASYENALKALENNDITYAMKTAVLEEQVDALEKKLRVSHIDRLSNAECNVNSGIHFLEMLGNLERVSDHAMNIAQVVLNENRTEKNYHDEAIMPVV